MWSAVWSVECGVEQSGVEQSGVELNRAPVMGVECGAMHVAPACFVVHSNSSSKAACASSIVLLSLALGHPICGTTGGLSRKAAEKVLVSSDCPSRLPHSIIDSATTAICARCGA